MQRNIQPPNMEGDEGESVGECQKEIEKNTKAVRMGGRTLWLQ